MSVILQFITGVFVEHPSSMGETYLTHMWHALGVSARMAMGACAAAVHAFFPFVFTDTASGIAREVAARVAYRHVSSSPRLVGYGKAGTSPGK